MIKDSACATAPSNDRWVVEHSCGNPNRTSWGGTPVKDPHPIISIPIPAHLAFPSPPVSGDSLGGLCWLSAKGSTDFPISAGALVNGRQVHADTLNSLIITLGKFVWSSREK
jgi:hypothetical protein